MVVRGGVESNGAGRALYNLREKQWSRSIPIQDSPSLPGENLYNRRAMIVRYTVPYSMLPEFTV